MSCYFCHHTLPMSCQEQPGEHRALWHLAKKKKTQNQTITKKLWVWELYSAENSTNDPASNMFGQNFVVSEEPLIMTVGWTIIASDLEKLGGLDVFCLLCAAITKKKLAKDWISQDLFCKSDQNQIESLEQRQMYFAFEYKTYQVSGGQRMGK